MQIGFSSNCKYFFLVFLSFAAFESRISSAVGSDAAVVVAAL